MTGLKSEVRPDLEDPGTLLQVDGSMGIQDIRVHRPEQ